MWLWHRTKAILFVVVIIISKDDTDALTRDDRRLSAAWGRPTAHKQGKRAASYHVLRQSESVDNSSESKENSTESSSIDSVSVHNEAKADPYLHTNDTFWSSMIKYQKKAEERLINYAAEDTIRVCYIIATTYMSALTDLRRYFIMRHFYENNLEFEIGYMTHEIISKYQRMLEMFYMAEKRYFSNVLKNIAPTTYMLYMYTNVLEIANVIKHLCHMLNEIETKYMLMPDTGFSDYQLGGSENEFDKQSKNETADQTYKRLLAQYKIFLIKQRKARIRQKRKELKKLQKKGYDPEFNRLTTPDRRPRKSKHWPLEYGWSIEHWP